jgi:hypothetical protein
LADYRSDSSRKEQMSMRDQYSLPGRQHQGEQLVSYGWDTISGEEAILLCNYCRRAEQ